MRFTRCLCPVAILVMFGLAACTAPAQGPTTWLDRPLDGDQVAMELVPIQAHASDASGIGKFEFFINDSPLSSPAGSGTRFSQATAEWVPPAPGTYVVRARSVNGAGVTGAEARAVIMVGAMTPTPTAAPAVIPAPKAAVTPTVFVINPAPLPVGDITTTPTPTVFIINPAPLPVGDITITPTPKPACAGVPVISTFSANPGTITAGGSTTLTWSPLTNANGAVINPGLLGVGVSGGSMPVQPSTTTTYVLSATGCGGTVVQSVTVTVLPAAPVCPGPPVIASFNANPGTITAGQSTTLSWGAVTNADGASIDPGIGGVGTPGSVSVSPSGTTTYVLTATGCGGATQRRVTVTVNAAPPPPPPPPPPSDTTPPSISNLSANPTSISQSGCGQHTTTTVSATVTDAGGVDHVVARLTGAGGGEVAMGPVGGNVYRADVGPFNSAGQLVVRVVAWDRAGNLAQSGTQTVNVVCIK